MPIPDNDFLRRVARDFSDNAPDNRIRPEAALRPDLEGMRLYGEPLVGVAAADDPAFAEMLRPEVIGSHFLAPGDWLPGAQSVIAYFLPFTPAVIDSNRADPVLPSDEWLHGRFEGQAAADALGALLVREIGNAGHRAVHPSSSDRFWSHAKPAGRNARGMDVPGHTSNWSERHVAFACGLGTFGLSTCLITEKGTAGRLGSVVTTLPLRPDARPYTRYDEYCTRCGMCAQRCFAGSIDREKGKDRGVCERLLDERKIQHAPRYGCGKCNVRVPCEREKPKTARTPEP